MTQKGDESQSGTIEMNETLKARGTPLGEARLYFNEVPFSLGISFISIVLELVSLSVSLLIILSKKKK